MQTQKMWLGGSVALFIAVSLMLASENRPSMLSQIAQTISSKTSSSIVSGVCGKPNGSNPNALDFSNGVVLLKGAKYFVPRTEGLTGGGLTDHYLTDFYVVAAGRSAKVVSVPAVSHPSPKVPFVKIATAKWNGMSSKHELVGIIHSSKSCANIPSTSSITVLSPKGGETFSNSKTERIPISIKVNGGNLVFVFFVSRDGFLCRVKKISMTGNPESKPVTDYVDLRYFLSNGTRRPYPNGYPCEQSNPARYVVPGRYQVLARLYGYDTTEGGVRLGTVVAEDWGDAPFTITK